MKSYSSKEILKILSDDGWYIIDVRGSHHHLRHPIKTGKVTVPHPKKSFPQQTIRSIFKQAGLEI